mmetsp:Transcript_29701/g.74553  ORF Transcript_29701/g.74553 Transcript_29701/m.74553 type:complete len:109 (+) Transcript_29701:1901-2227(+)
MEGGASPAAALTATRPLVARAKLTRARGAGWAGAAARTATAREDATLADTLERERRAPGAAAAAAGIAAAARNKTACTMSTELGRDYSRERGREAGSFESGTSGTQGG